MCVYMCVCVCVCVGLQLCISSCILCKVTHSNKEGKNLALSHCGQIITYLEIW